MVRAIVFVLLLVASIGAAAGASWPKGFEANPYSGSAPAPTAEGEVDFRIFDRKCSSKDYGDGRGESDCNNGNVRSMLWTKQPAKLGSAVDYSFDIWVDPGLAYAGYKNNFAANFLPDSWDSGLWAAWWEGDQLHNFFYILKVDTTKGLTFLGNTCQAPQAFGQWVNVSMRVRWSDDEKGWLQLRCDDRLVYAEEGRPTLQAPHCFATNQCEPGVEKHPKKVIFNLGVHMAGLGHTWKDRGLESPFVEIQPDGINVKIRSIKLTPDPVAYSPDDKVKVKQLQERLAALGCDPGSADGVPGKKTREAALSCRAFPDGALPTAFSLATLDRFLELYSDPSAETLQPGVVPGQLVTVPATFNVRAAEAFEDKNDPGRLYVEIRAEFRLKGKPTVTVEFAIEQLQMQQADHLGNFQLMFLGGGLKGGEALGDCDAEALPWPGSPPRLALNIKNFSSDYVARNVDCISAQLKKPLRERFDILVNNFSDIGVELAKSGELENLHNPAIKRFFTELATGEATFKAQK